MSKKSQIKVTRKKEPEDAERSLLSVLDILIELYPERAKFIIKQLNDDRRRQESLASQTEIG